uniref:Interleukin 17 receptor C n=1 Tax=Hucho hucho TaxID=62062 RepID=A0A4W5Q525_9TELE
WLSLLLESKALSFSSQVTVYVCSLHSTVVLPSVDEVNGRVLLLSNLPVCLSVPSFNTMIDQERREVMLQVAMEKDSPYQLEMCLQHEHNGMCRVQKSVPLHSVTPCMCFQLWWDKGDQRSRRSRSCPFRNNTELFQRNLWENVSVSVVQGQMNSGGAMLSWNLTAPCRVEAEVWPCQRDAGVDKDRCTELGDIRQSLSNDIWRENDRGHWVHIPEHLIGASNFLLVGLGYNSYLYFSLSARLWHWRWCLLVLLSLMLVGLAGLCLYFLHGKLKREGHVVLLSPPDVNNSVSKLVCELGSSLRARGLSVSVDLWSRAELCSLGPLPWLHSQLQPLDSQGGRALLVLTQAASKKAEDWGQQWDQQGQQGRDIAQGVEEEGEYKRLLQGLSSPYADVFSAALSCIKVDHQQGCAGKRFLLVHFEAHSAKPLSSERGLPELFQGLPLFNLPSQRQELLVQLAIGSKGPGAGIGG